MYLNTKRFLENSTNKHQINKVPGKKGHTNTVCKARYYTTYIRLGIKYYLYGWNCLEMCGKRITTLINYVLVKIINNLRSLEQLNTRWFDIITNDLSKPFQKVSLKMVS